MQNFLNSAPVLLFLLNLLPLAIYIYTLKPLLDVIRVTDLPYPKSILINLSISILILFSSSALHSLLVDILNASPVQITIGETIILIALNTILFQLSSKFINSMPVIITNINKNHETIERLSVFYDSTTDGILISEIDDMGNAKVIDCNERIVLMTGYSRAEIVNGNQSEFLDHDTRKTEIINNQNRVTIPYLSHFYRSNGTSFPVVIKNTFPNNQSNIKVTSVRTLEGDLLIKQNKEEQSAAIGLLLEQFKPNTRNIDLLGAQNTVPVKGDNLVKESLKSINKNIKDLLGEL